MNIKIMFNKINTKLAAVAVAVVLAVVAIPTDRAEANNNYYYTPAAYQYQPATYGQIGTNNMTNAEMIAFLKQLIAQLQAQLGNQGTYYSPIGYHNYNYSYVVGQPRGGSSNNDDDEPEVETDRATAIENDEAELEGNVDMMDFEDGEVFFVYGTDEDQIEDVEDDYDTYSDIDEDGDDLQKVMADSSFDDEDDFNERVTGLEEDTDYYFQICVGFEDEDNDEVIVCGGVDEFTTDQD